MQIRQNQQFCAQMLHAHRRLGLACWGWLLLGSLLWLLELLAAALVLRIRNTLPVSLLTEQALLWRLVQLFWLVPAWLVWNWCSWSLWRRCTAVVSMLPHRRPAGRKKQLWLALQNTLLRTLLLQTVTLCLFGAYQLGKRTVSVRRRAAAGAGDTLPSGVVLCLPGAVVRAVRLLCPSGTAGVESTPCGNACHARRQKGTAGTAGLVWPADAARGDHPLGVASGGAVGDGVL